MPDVDFGQRCLQALTSRGFDKAAVRIVDTERHELNAEFNRPSLLRTNRNVRLELNGITDDRRGSVVINRCTADALAEAVDELWTVAEGSPPDPANESHRSPDRPRRPRTISRAVRARYDRLAEFIDYTRDNHPNVTLRQGVVDFTATHQLFLNSNGVEFTPSRGCYRGQAMFSAKEGTDTSSFSSAGFTRYALDQPLHTYATVAALLQQTSEQVRTRQVPEKFSGDLIIAPVCLQVFVGFLAQSISGAPMITGTSLYKDRLGEQVASNLLNLRSEPLGMPGGYFVTDDGFEVDNATILDRGMLTSYLLDLYAANKTGLERSASPGGCFSVAPGATSRDDLIGAVERGILITRFSGGRPNDKGDFSGVAKNSYYVEGGEIKFPVSETMVSGNIAEILQNIVGISKETADFGYGVYPWVRTTGVGVS